MIRFTALRRNDCLDSRASPRSFASTTVITSYSIHYTKLYELDPGDIWLAIVLGHLTRASLSVLVFRRGRWRDIEIRLGEGAEGVVAFEDADAGGRDETAVALASLHHRNNFV